jgi:AcrR family transcriptional regulator
VPQPPRSARGEKTRDALRRAAQVRFLAQGIEETSAEQIAHDAGVSLRTFYRHFASKLELLYGDYDASLDWFRSALDSRPPGEPLIEAVLVAINSYPYEPASMLEIAALRDRALDRESIERHIHQVQAEFAAEIERHLLRVDPLLEGDDKFLSSVMAQCIAAATFAALDTWMRGDHSDLEDLARLTEMALTLIDRSLVPVRDRPANMSN